MQDRDQKAQDGYTMRRARMNPILRDMLADTVVTPDNLMYPVFLIEGESQEKPISSMPGVSQFTVDKAADHLRELIDSGLRSVMLFGVVSDSDKDEVGSHILSADSLVARALRAFREAELDLLFAVDLCFCEYTDHGHCGVLSEKTTVDNRKTVAKLAEQAVVLASAGADLIAPSGMMDGAVGAIRRGLDAHSCDHIPIMGYSVKYASSFYGPFRDAADSAPQFGDRKQYQQDYRRDRREAIREAELDVAEGADIVMVKPAMAYLDVLSALRDRLTVPLAAYQVSGEYAMLKAAAEKGWIDYEGVLCESLIALRRAGSSIILSYAVPDALTFMVSRGYIG